MDYKNLSISKKLGKFYEKSSTPKEGYQEVTYGEGKKTYHSYIDTISGIIDDVSTKEVSFEGRNLNFLEVSVVEGDLNNKVSMNLKNKGGYTDEVKAFVSSLKGYKIGEPVTITPRTRKTTGKNGKEYENLNIYINYQNIKNEDGKGASTGYINFNDIPAPIKEDDGMGGTEWNWKPQTVFYFNELENIINKFKSNTTSTPPPAQKTFETIPAEESTFVPESDDLPF